jgi:3-methyladenine DNA glycosylase AlkD
VAEKRTIKERLFALQDQKYQAFQRKLCPDLDPETIIGVRVPLLRKLAKELSDEGEAEAFLRELPHTWYEENMLHVFLISGEKDFDRVLKELDRILPYIDNWASCDSLSPRVFKKRHGDLLPVIDRCLASDHEYTIRFGIKMLMDHFLDEDFDPALFEKVLSARRDALDDFYYVRMMKAWYFATALAKQWESAVRVIEERKLDRWTHNKTIQKARESFRVSDAHKDYLKSLRW